MVFFSKPNNGLIVDGMKGSAAILHVWYRIIGKYLQDQDVYYLCVAFPIIKDEFPLLCNSICYEYEMKNPYACEWCFIRFQEYTDEYYFHNADCKEASPEKIDYFFPILKGKNRQQQQQRHSFFVLQTPSKRYKCSLCRREYSEPTLSKLRQHMYNEHKHIPCLYCLKYWRGYYLFRAHQYTVHSVPKGFTCTICHKQYYSKSSLRRHQKKGHNDLNENYI